jgi:ribosomal protein S3AE
MPPKTTKLLTKRKKFLEVDIPAIRQKIELIAESVEELKDRTIKLDLTRQLKGKSVEAVVKISLEHNKPVAHPIKIKLMPYFIRRMIRKRISYVEDSFIVPSQENMILVKPFLITRKRVSKAVRKTLRNKAKNWLQDYIAERKNNEIFSDILSNRMQKPLSLMLKKTYPLSLCEIRIIEVKRALSKEEVPEIKEKISLAPKMEIEEGLDQFAEIEQERLKKAEKEIKETQEKAIEIESSESKQDSSEPAPKKRGRKKKAEESAEVKEESA